MTAIVTGNGLGLTNSSLGLGAQGQLGAAEMGKDGERVYVNAATGNLVVQDQDEWLVGLGPDVAITRTYNSQSGSVANANVKGNWRLGYSRMVVLTSGVAGQTGSTVVRVAEDGAETTYTWDASQGAYVGREGLDAKDQIFYLGTQWLWVDGATQQREFYKANGQLTSVIDPNGHGISISYTTAGLIETLTDDSGETVKIEYDTAGRIADELTTFKDSAGATQTLKRVSYTYYAATTTDARLKSVWVYMGGASTPSQSVSAYAGGGTTYVTTYTYVNNADPNSTLIQSIKQSDNSTLTFAYDGANRVQSITQKTIANGVSVGAITTFDYSQLSSGVVKVTDPKQGVTTLTFDTASKKLLSVQQPSVAGVSSGTTITPLTQFNYDPATGNLSSRIDARGNISTYQYDAAGNRTYERDPSGHVVTRTYATNSNLLLTQTVYTGLAANNGDIPSGAQTTRYAYDSGNNLRFEISPQGRVTEYQYNNTTTAGQVEYGAAQAAGVVIQGQLSSTIEYAANAYAIAGLAATAAPSLSEMTTWLAQTGASALDKAQTQRTDYRYDARGLLKTKTTYDFVGADGQGQATTAHITSYTYDQAGNLLQSIDAKQHVTTYAYDGLNRLDWQTDGAGLATQWSYVDHLGSLYSAVTRQAANGLQTVSIYDQAGHLLEVDSENSSSGTSIGMSSYNYDNLGRLVDAEDQQGQHTYSLYDADGRLVGQISPERELTEFAYNADGEVVRTVAYANVVDTSFLTDPSVQTNGNFDPTKLTLAWVKGKLQTTISGQDRTSYKLYDAAGRLAKTIDAAGAVVEYSYDGAGRLIKTTAYNTGLSTSQLSALQSATSEILPSDPNTGVTTDAYNDRVQRRIYSADGLLVGTIDALSYYTKNDYDSAGRLIRSTRYANAVTNSIVDGVAPQVIASGTTPPSSAYVLANNANDQITQTFYNAQGQVLGVLDAEGYFTGYRYDAAGNTLSVTRYATQLSAAASIRNAANVYAIDFVVTIAFMTPGGNAIGYLYPSASLDHSTSNVFDADNRLLQTTSQPDGLITTYTYDAVGNVVQKVVGYGQADARTSNVQYDLLGRVTAELNGEGSAALIALGANPTQTAIDGVWAQYATRYTYDAAGRRSSASTPNGSGGHNQTLYFYDHDGRLTHTVNALGEVSETRYDAFGDALTQRLYATRLSSAQLSALQASIAAGNDLAAVSTVTVSGTTTSLIAILNSLANAQDSITSAGYDQRGLAVTQTDALQNVSTRVYNNFAELAWRADAIQGSTTTSKSYEYDQRGQLILGLEATVGSTLRYTDLTNYDAFGRVTETLDSKSYQPIQYTYDKLGRQVTVTDRTVGLSQTTYDAFSRVRTQKDALGKTTTTTYDDVNRTVTVTTPEGLTAGFTTTAQNNLYGQVFKVTDGRGDTTTYTYNHDGQLTDVSAKDAAGTQLSTSHTDYDSAGRAWQTRDARGSLTQTTFDAANRVLTRVVDAGGLNLTTNYLYDGKGQAVWVQDPSGVWTHTEYDLKGEVVAITVDPQSIPDGSGGFKTNAAGVNLRTEYVYDARGKTLQVTEGAGSAQPKVTKYVYDLVGRRTQEIVDPTPTTSDGKTHLNIKTVYAYDKNDNVVTKTDPNGNVTRFVYDGQDRLIYTVDPTGAVRKTEYDADGRVSRATAYADRITPTSNTATGITTALTTANANYATNSANQVEVRMYDGDGHLTYVIDARKQIVKREYDKAGNVVKLIRYATPLQSALTVAQQIGDLVSFAAPSYVTPSAQDQIEQYVYDGANRLTFKVDPLGYVTQNTYDANSNVVSVTKYYAARKFKTTSQTTLTTNVAPKLLPPPGTDLSGLSSTDSYVVLDPAHDQTTTSFYDKANRPTFQIDAAGYVTQHTYDANGNVTAVTRYFSVRVTQSQPRSSLPANEVAISGSGLNAGDITVVKDAQLRDQTTTRYYDSAGRPAFQVDASGYVTQNAYDANDNVTAVTRYFHAQVKQSQSRSSLPVNEVAIRGNGLNAGDITVVKDDQHDQTTANYYDAAGRPAIQVDAGGYVTQNTYDADGNVTATRSYFNASVKQQLVRSSLPANEVAISGSGLNAGDITVIKDDQRDQITSSYYDGTGHLKLAVDAEGYLSKREYNALGQLTKTTRYDAQLSNLNLLSTSNEPQIDPASTPADRPYLASNTAKDAVTFYAYDLAGNLTDTTEAYNTLDATTTHQTYDAFGNVTDVYTAYQKPEETRTHYQYDTNGRLTDEIHGYQKGQSSDEYAHTRYVLDGFGNRVKVVSPYGMALVESTSTWASTTRGSFGIPFPSVGSADYNTLIAKGTTTQQFDALGHVTCSTDPNGGQISTEYDAFGNAVKVTDPNQNAGFFYFDANNRAVWHVDPEHYAVQTTYDAFGNVSTIKRFVTQADGAIATAAPPVPYSGPIRPTAASCIAVNNDPVGGDQTTTLYHDKLNRQIQITDAAGYSEYQTFDGLGNKTSVTNKLGGTTTYQYDRKGNLITETLPVQVYHYDSNGDPLLVTDTQSTQYGKPQWFDVVNTYTYDARGNKLTSSEAGSQRMTLYTYDALNRLTSQSSALPNNIVWYDNTGAKQSSSVASSQAFKYDALGNLIETRTFQSGSSLGDTQGSTWARSLQYFDALGRKVAEVSPTGSVKAYVYNVAGDVIQQRSCVNSVQLPVNPGGTLQWSRSGYDRIVTFQYDANHRLLSTTQSEVTTGEVNAVSGNFELAARDLTTRRTYDANGNLRSETDPRGNTTWHYYDKLGNEIIQIDAERYITYWTRDAGGNVLQEYRFSTQLDEHKNPDTTLPMNLMYWVASRGDARETVYVHDKMGRVISRTVSGVQAAIINSNGGTDSTTSDATTSFDINGLGEVTARHEATGETLSWEFDKAGREIKSLGAAFVAVDGQTRQQVTKTEYTGLGQVARVIELSTSGLSDRVSKTIYAANGRAAASVDAAGAKHLFTYDAAEHLTSDSITRTDADGSTTTDVTAYTFDLSGRQVKQVVQGVRTIETLYNTFGDVSNKRTYALTAPNPNSGYRWQEYYYYDRAGRLICGLGQDGICRAYIYDANNNVTMTLENKTEYSGNAIIGSDEITTVASAVGNIGYTKKLSIYNKNNKETDHIELSPVPIGSNSNVAPFYGDQADSITGVYTWSSLNRAPVQGDYLGDALFAGSVAMAANENITGNYQINFTDATDTINSQTVPDPNNPGGTTVQYSVDSKSTNNLNTTLSLANKGFNEYGDGDITVKTTYTVYQTAWDNKGQASSGIVYSNFTSLHRFQNDTDQLSFSDWIKTPGSAFQLSAPSGSYTGAGVAFSPAYFISVHYEVYKETPYGSIKLAEMDPEKQKLQATTARISSSNPIVKVTWQNISATIPTATPSPSPLIFNGLPPDTTTVLVSLKPAGGAAGYDASLPWKTVRAQPFKVNNNVVPGWFSVDRDTILPLWSQYGCDFTFTALDETGNTLSSHSGTIWTLTSVNCISYDQYENNGYKDDSTLFSGRSFIDPDGYINITKQGNAKTLRVKYHLQGANNPWTEAPALASPFSTDGIIAKGWFRFDPGEWGLTGGATYDYEVIGIGDDGGLVASSVGQFSLTADGTKIVPASLMSSTSPDNLKPRNKLPQVIHYDNLPKDSVRAVLRYTLKSGGATTSVDLTCDSPGCFTWNAVSLALELGGTSNVYFDVEVQTFDAAGRQLLGFQSIVGLSPSSSSLPNTTQVSNAVVPQQSGQIAIAPPFANAAAVTLYYRKVVGGADTAVTSTTKDVYGRFVFDLSAQLPAVGETNFEYYYRVYSSATTQDSSTLLSTPDSYALFTTVPTSSARARFTLNKTAAPAQRFVLMGVVDPSRTSHTRQTYNAYGEVATQTDALDRVTVLQYNALGKLTDKIDPTVQSTAENGFVSSVTPTTHYDYDLQGRLVRVLDPNQHATSYTWLGEGVRGQSLAYQEFHADGGVKTLAYDEFGDMRRSTEIISLGATHAQDDTVSTNYDYDVNHRVTKVTHVQRKDAGYVGQSAVDSYTYDELGHRVSHTAGEGSAALKDRTYFDALGRVVKTISAQGRTETTSYVYDEAIFGLASTGGGGWRITHTSALTAADADMIAPGGSANAVPATTVDETDIFGHLMKHTDLGGHTFKYQYNAAGWLMRQLSNDGASSTGQSIAYRYFTDGHLATIRDTKMDTITRYQYDKAGNKIFEGYATNSNYVWQYYQKAKVSYDALNRVTDVVDSQYSVHYEYDTAGNRRRVRSTSSAGTQDYWYAYDSMNRFTVTMGKLVVGPANSDTTVSGVVAQGANNSIQQGLTGNGVRLTYDLLSQRTSATYATDGRTEFYDYTADGFLTDVRRSASEYASRRAVNLLGQVTTLTEYQPGGVYKGYQSFRYDNDGKVTWSTSDDTTTKSTSTTTNVLAGDGTLKSVATTVISNEDPAHPVTTNIAITYKYTFWDSAQQASITQTQSSLAGGGQSIFSYDVNGHLARVKDTTFKRQVAIYSGSSAPPGTLVQTNRTLRYITNAQGLVLRRNEIGGFDSAAIASISTGPRSGSVGSGEYNTLSHQENYYYFDGQRIGEAGNDPGASSVDYAQALAASNKVDRKTQRWAPRPITSNFDANYQAINSSYPGYTSTGYVVREGDTLESIANSVWGDRSLWYLIAEANGLSSNTELAEGQSLEIPNKVTNVRNSSGTHAVYDPSDVLGDVSPTMPSPPPPPQVEDCGVLGLIIVIVIAIVVTVLTEGALTGPAVEAGGTAAAGTASTAITLSDVAIGAASAAAGSFAGQTAAIAMGMQKGGYDWDSVGKAAIGGAIGSALKGWDVVDELGAATKAASTNVLTQGASMALGLQKKFDWRGVAAAGLSAGIDKLFVGNAPIDSSSGFGKQVAAGLVSGGLSAAIYDKRPDWRSIAANSLGSAIGETLKPTAFQIGRALGDAVVGSIQQADAEKKNAQQLDEKRQEWLENSVAGPSNSGRLTGVDPRVAQFRALVAKQNADFDAQRNQLQDDAAAPTQTRLTQDGDGQFYGPSDQGEPTRFKRGDGTGIREELTPEEHALHESESADIRNKISARQLDSIAKSHQERALTASQLGDIIEGIALRLPANATTNALIEKYGQDSVISGTLREYYTYGNSNYFWHEMIPDSPVVQLTPELRTYMDKNLKSANGERLQVRAPDGSVYDTGHLFSGIDSVRYPNESSIVRGFGINNIDGAGLSGDMATAFLGRWDKDRPEIADAYDHYASIGDRNGDLAGIHLGAILRDNPRATMADTVRNYFSPQGEYSNRFTTFLDETGIAYNKDTGLITKEGKSQLSLRMENFSRAYGLYKYTSKSAVPVTNTSDWKYVVNRTVNWIDSRGKTDPH